MFEEVDQNVVGVCGVLPAPKFEQILDLRGMLIRPSTRSMETVYGRQAETKTE